MVIIKIRLLYLLQLLNMFGILNNPPFRLNLKSCLLRYVSKMAELYIMKKKIIFFIFILISINVVVAQIPADMSKVRSSDISDAQLKEFVEKAQASGQSETQIIQEFSRRGMQAVEINKLRTRMSGIVTATTINNATAMQTPDRKAVKISQPVYSQVKSEIFGSELFSNPSLTFEPDLKLPTPKNYTLGPDDKLLLDVFGINLSQQELKVSPEGTVNIKYAGPVQIGGLTVEEASNLITKKLSKFYPAINSGKTKTQLTLTGIRTIKVIVIGAVKKPGSYSLSSLSTLFNALYVSGGPTDNGSFRNIELIRNNKTIVTADLYEFLMSGTQKANVRLHDNDVIRIPYAKTKVEIKGEVNRQGYFEMQAEEPLNKLLEYAGGFTSNAFKARITGIRNTDLDKVILDIKKNDIEKFIPQNGDEFFVGDLLEKYQNRIIIEGAVFKPGTYSLENGLTISQLITKAEGLREDAYLSRVIVTRTREDLTKEIINLDLKSTTDNQFQLQKEDVVEVSSIFDIKDQFTVSINGAVRTPGIYKFEDNLSLKTLIQMAGGFADNATGQGIEISRRKRDVDVNTPGSAIVEIIKIDDNKDLSKQSADVILKPFDIITVKVDPYYKSQISVTIQGEVLNPGTYTLTSRSEKISDLIKRAGKMLYTADVTGARLIRRNYLTNEDAEAIERIAQTTAKDTSGVILKQEIKPYKEVSIALPKIIDNPGSKDDILLEEGDVVIIPAIDNMVSIAGEVYKPVAVNYNEGKKIRDYINDAGGLTNAANKRRLFVVYPNGKAASTKKTWLFFRKYPEVTAGAKIFVPKEPEKKQGDIAKVGVVVSAISGLITTLAIVYQITR